MTQEILTWNEFTKVFGTFLHGYKQSRDADAVVERFEEYIDKYGYKRVRELIVSYLQYYMDMSVYTAADGVTVIGHKPAWFDHKYTMKYVLEILDAEFEE